MPSALPPGLSKYRAYLDRGAELATAHPLAAYHCRLQYLTIAVHLKPSLQLSRDEQMYAQPRAAAASPSICPRSHCPPDPQIAPLSDGRA